MISRVKEVSELLTIFELISGCGIGDGEYELGRFES